jgi:glycosyltransferase involved in cell wall biosynthesis
VKVLHVVATAQRRGAEVFAADLVGELERRGVDQRVAVLRDAGSEKVSFEAPTAVVPSAGWRLPGARFDPGRVRRLRRSARAWSPDILQAHGGEAFKHLAVGLGGSPLIYRRIGWSWVRGRARRWGHRRLMRRATRIVAVAEAVRRETVEVFGVPGERVVTIPRGVDPRRVETGRDRAGLRRELEVPEAAPVILWLGALTWEKDPLAGLEAAALALEAVPGSIYLVAGEGPLRGPLQEAVATKGLTGRVRLLGARPDVAELLAASDVLLLASRSEGMPGAVIEAGMAGVPAVAPEVAGVPEVVAHGQTGLLAPAGDTAALAALLEKGLGDEGLRRRLGREARRRYREAFGIGSVTQRYLDLYEEVVRRT